MATGPWNLTLAAAIVAAVASAVVVMLDNTIDAIQNHEHRITKLEQQMQQLRQSERPSQ